MSRDPVEHVIEMYLLNRERLGDRFDLESFDLSPDDRARAEVLLRILGLGSRVFEASEPLPDHHLVTVPRRSTMRQSPSPFSVNSQNLPSDKKVEAYRAVLDVLREELRDEVDATVIMSTVASVLRCSLPYYYWAGFYRVDPARDRELIVGPYQGTVATPRIPFEKGVCGAAARTGQAQIVPDVDDFPGHIACDCRSKSEIALPVYDANGNLIGVFDVDSTKKASFDDTDREWLETIIDKFLAQSQSTDVA